MRPSLDEFAGGEPTFLARLVAAMDGVGSPDALGFRVATRGCAVWAIGGTSGREDDVPERTEGTPVSRWSSGGLQPAGL